jgi:hypothetical protein
VGGGRIPRDELTGRDDATLLVAARAHRLAGDDAEDVLATRLDRVVTGAPGHQQDTAVIART